MPISPPGGVQAGAGAGPGSASGCGRAGPAVSSWRNWAWMRSQKEVGTRASQATQHTQGKVASSRQIASPVWKRMNSAMTIRRCNPGAKGKNSTAGPQHLQRQTGEGQVAQRFGEVEQEMSDARGEVIRLQRQGDRCAVGSPFRRPLPGGGVPVHQAKLDDVGHRRRREEREAPRRGAASAVEGVTGAQGQKDAPKQEHAQQMVAPLHDRRVARVDADEPKPVQQSDEGRAPAHEQKQGKDTANENENSGEPDSAVEHEERKGLQAGDGVADDDALVAVVGADVGQPVDPVEQDHHGQADAEQGQRAEIEREEFAQRQEAEKQARLLLPRCLLHDLPILSTQSAGPSSISS